MYVFSYRIHINDQTLPVTEVVDFLHVGRKDNVTPTEIPNIFVDYWMYVYLYSCLNVTLNDGP